MQEPESTQRSTKCYWRPCKLFQSRFQDIETADDKVPLFMNLFTYFDRKIEAMEEKLQLEIIDLKCTSLLKSRLDEMTDVPTA